MIAFTDNEKLRQQFSARLNEACDDSDLPPPSEGRATVIQQELSRRAKPISLPAVIKWLEADAIPGAANLKALAEWLGVRREWLQYGELPKYGAVALPVQAGPLTQRLAVKLAALEQEGKLNQKLVRAINAILDAAS